MRKALVFAATLSGSCWVLLKILSFLASEIFQHMYLGIATQIPLQANLAWIGWGYLNFQVENRKTSNIFSGVGTLRP